MEHLIILLINFILWVDKRSLKPLQRVVPRLGELRQHPAAVLAEGDITIGAYRRWGSGIALGMLAALVAAVMGVALLVGLTGGRPGALPGPVAVAALVLVLGIIPVAVLVWVVRLFRGGTMVLKRTGVELYHRGVTVHCPWALFNAPGVPFQPGRNRLLFPVAPNALPYVRAERGGEVLAQGARVRTRAFRFKAANLVLLRGVYEVEIVELGWLLLQVGRQLGDVLPDEVHVVDAHLEAEAPLRRRPDGWVRASLVQLTFPPYCAACGSYTADRKEYACYAHGVRLGGLTLFDAGDSTKVEVPACRRCQHQLDRVRRNKILAGLTLGLLTAVLLTVWVCAEAGNGRMAVLFLPFAVVGMFVGGYLGNRIARGKTDPVRLRDYSPFGGTVQLWFRRPEYADALLEILGGEDEVEPDDAEEPLEAVYDEL